MKVFYVFWVAEGSGAFSPHCLVHRFGQCSCCFYRVPEFKHSVLKATQFAFQRSMVFYLPEYPTRRASEVYTWLCCTVLGKRAYPQVLVTKTFRTFFNSSGCFFPRICILACIVVIFVVLSIFSYFSNWSIYFLSYSREDWGSSRLRTHSELSSVFLI